MQTHLTRPMRAGPAVRPRPVASQRFTMVGWCISAAILACVFEGAFRKWVFFNSSPAIQAIMYFSKDIPLGLAVLSCLSRPAGGGLLRPLYQLLVAGTMLFALGSLGSLQGLAPVGAVVSARNAVVLPWVAYVACRGLRGRADLPLILHTIGACAVINSVVGGMQFFAPPDHWLNIQVKEGLEAIGSVGRIRASGTFSFLNAMADLCIVACWAAGILLGANPKSWAGYVYAVAGLACSAESMARNGIAYGVAILAASVVLQPRTRFILPVLFLVGGLSTLVSEGNPESAGEDDAGIATAVFERHKSGSDTFAARATSGIEDLFHAVSDVPMGVGLGSGQTGQSAVSSDFAGAYEGEPGRLVYEVGIVGLLGAATIRVGVPLLLWKYLPPQNVFRVGFSGAVWIPSVVYLLMSFNMLVVFDHFQATYQAVALTCVLAVAGGHARAGEGVARAPR